MNSYVNLFKWVVNHKQLISPVSATRLGYYLEYLWALPNKRSSEVNIKTVNFLEVEYNKKQQSKACIAFLES